MTNTIKAGTKVKVTMSALPETVSLLLLLTTQFFEEEFEVAQVVEDENFSFKYKGNAEGDKDAKELVSVVKETVGFGNAFTILIPETSAFKDVAKDELFVDGFMELPLFGEDSVELVG